jgi:hypothetical protein
MKKYIVSLFFGYLTTHYQLNGLCTINSSGRVTGQLEGGKGLERIGRRVLLFDWRS